MTLPEMEQAFQRQIEFNEGVNRSLQTLLELNKGTMELAHSTAVSVAELRATVDAYIKGIRNGKSRKN